MNRHISEVEFVIFDTETTGLDPQGGDRIVEIAAIKLIGQKRLATFQALVNPGRPVSEGAFRVNNISDDMLKGAPRMEAVIPSFLEFIQDSCLCSYNAGFDMGFLNNELRLARGGELQNIVVDILRMSRRMLPGLERYALWFVADHLGVKDRQAHRALSDVEMTLEVFHRLNKICGEKGICTFSHLCCLFGLDSRRIRDVRAQKIDAVQLAIDRKMTLRIKYLSSSGCETSEREVMPKMIRIDNGQAYLTGYCSLRKEERTFKIDGILHLEAI